jgi:hypothetical protein
MVLLDSCFKSYQTTYDAEAQEHRFETDPEKGLDDEVRALT